MAAADNIRVSVEAAIHTALRRCAEQIRDEFGIHLNSAHFEWVDTSTILSPRQELGVVRIETTQRAAK